MPSQAATENYLQPVTVNYIGLPLNVVFMSQSGVQIHTYGGGIEHSMAKVTMNDLMYKMYN